MNEGTISNGTILVHIDMEIGVRRGPRTGLRSATPVSGRVGDRVQETRQSFHTSPLDETPPGGNSADVSIRYKGNECPLCKIRELVGSVFLPAEDLQFAL